MRDVKRIVNSSFWEDEKVATVFSPEDKYFFLYLLTNPHTTQIGIYRLIPKIAAFELGYSLDSVMVLLDRFENKYGIIKYSQSTSEVAVKNYLKHSIVKGGKPVMDCLVKESKGVKDKSLLRYVYENIRNIDELNITVKEFIEYLISILGNENENENDNENERIVDDSSSQKSSDSSPKKSGSKTNSTEKVLEAWNDMCKRTGLSWVRALPQASERHRMLNARIFEYGEDAVIEAIGNIEGSPFLCGDNAKGWRIDFGWLVRPNNFPKVLEGKYGKAKKAMPKTAPESKSVPESVVDREIEEERNKVDQMTDEEYEKYFMKTFGGE